MAVVLLPGGSDMAGKPVNIILPLVGQLCFQPGKLCIGQYHIVVSAISGGGGVSRFSLSLFFYLFLSISFRFGFSSPISFLLRFLFTFGVCFLFCLWDCCSNFGRFYCINSYFCSIDIIYCCITDSSVSGSRSAPEESFFSGKCASPIKARVFPCSSFTSSEPLYA